MSQHGLGLKKEEEEKKKLDPVFNRSAVLFKINNK
jgi:hypothetical protein